MVITDFRKLCTKVYNVGGIKVCTLFAEVSILNTSLVAGATVKPGDGTCPEEGVKFKCSRIVRNPEIDCTQTCMLKILYLSTLIEIHYYNFF